MGNVRRSETRPGKVFWIVRKRDAEQVDGPFYVVEHADAALRKLDREEGRRTQEARWSGPFQVIDEAFLMTPNPATESNRDSMVEEVEEYFNVDYESGGPPPWMFFVFSDAGIELWHIGDLADFDVDTAELMKTESLGQLENASPAQVACYAKAREAWLETP